MPSRQARRERRAAERKAKKAALRAAAATPVTPAPVPPCDDEEFTPEFIACANSMRERTGRLVAVVRGGRSERVSRRVGIDACMEPTRDHGFVSQPTPALDKSPAEELAAPISRRTEMNRANAQHSTGPRSSTGKLASSRNSLKHGLASGTLIIPGEDQTAFDALLNDLLSEHAPANNTEQMLIHEMGQSFWLAQRALRFQNDCFTEHGVDEKRLALFLRYHTAHERAFHKALNTLIRLQKDRHRAEHAASRGFVSQHETAIHHKRGFVSQPSAQADWSPLCASQTDHSQPSTSRSEPQNPPPHLPAEAA